jgi:hypothetical protein
VYYQRYCKLTVVLIGTEYNADLLYRALRTHFVNVETDDEPGINDARAFACEYVAWKCVLHLSEREAIDCLLTELPLAPATHFPNFDGEVDLRRQGRQNGLRIDRPQSVRIEAESLLHSPPLAYDESPRFDDVPRSHEAVFDEDNVGETENDSFASYFDNLNALEIAAVSGAKKFLSQRVVQKIVEKIWKGDIVFWETLSVDSEKKAKIYNKK